MKKCTEKSKEQEEREEFLKNWEMNNDMDDEKTFDEMKASYQEHIDQIIDFNEDDYGYGPMVFLEGYLAILGAGNEDDYVEHLVNAIKGEKLNEAADIETFYYLKDGKVQNS